MLIISIVWFNYLSIYPRIFMALSGFFSVDFLSTYFSTRHFLWLHLTYCSYKKLAIFTTNVEAENQAFGHHKTFCGALNRQFFVGAVMPSLFFFCQGLSIHCMLFWCVCLVALLDFLAWLCAFAKKNTNVPTNALANLFSF